jgi:[CysO sulfur-carrier protein]-S-L-cysteine hydrolase
VKVPAHILDDIVAHCRSEAPDEACGLLAADRWNPGLVVEHRRMGNVADNPAGEYEIDAAAQLAAWAELDAANRSVVALYHSHVFASAQLSGRDVAFAQDPRIAHLIVSLGGNLDFQVRLWRVERDSPGGPLIRVLGESLDIA